MKKKLYELWCAFTHKCPKCGEHLACNDNQFAYGNWYCPNCDGNCEEIGISESVSKTFPRVNEFEVGSSYRR